jgi:ESS family glutamate:Na+ symporter
MMQWGLVIDFAFVCVSLFAASILRARLRFLQRFLIPNAITAGFIGMGLVYLTEHLFPDIMPSREVLGNIVYHLLAITFISIALKKRDRYVDRNVVTTAFNLSLSYAVEGFVGYTITLLFLFTIMPDIFPTFGILFAIGFGQSSGHAYALGRGWEQLGFVSGGTVGLTFGSLGFLWACLVGIPFLNWGVRKGYVQDLDIAALKNRGFLPRGRQGVQTGRMTTHPDAISTGSFHIAFIGSVYFINYFFIRGIVALVGRTGSEYSLQFGQLLWAYHAPIAIMVSLLIAMLLNRLKLDHVLDDDMLTSISTASVDFLVTAAIMAIEVVVVTQYILPIMAICIVGGVTVMALIVFLAKRSFHDYFFQRVISIFGLLTGTISTGLALLRVIDPGYRTPAARDMALGSGLSLFFSFPLLLFINVPALNRTVRMYLLTDAVVVIYIVVIVAVMITTRHLMPKGRIRSEGF